MSLFSRKGRCPRCGHNPEPLPPKASDGGVLSADQMVELVEANILHRVTTNNLTFEQAEHLALEQARELFAQLKRVQQGKQS